MSVSDFTQGLVAAMKAKDLEETLERIDDQAIYFWSNGSAHFGKSQIAAALKVNFDAIANDTYRKIDVTWLVQSETVAACVYRFEWTGEIGGKAVSGKGRGTSVLRRTNGAWRVVHEHLSAGAWKD
ncbi:MAG TPA: nuclear transport factor 2 family protein [Caulobacteraceae bacterium]